VRAAVDGEAHALKPDVCVLVLSLTIQIEALKIVGEPFAELALDVIEIQGMPWPQEVGEPLLD
jgi:hypothetical protein